MKKINYIKIVLDILMAIVFVLLFNKMAVVPMTFHEFAGLFIGVVFITHITLNFKWVKQVTLKLFDSKVNARIKLGYIINVLLLICFVLIIISGALISKVVLPNFRINSSLSFKAIHMSMSYIALMIVGIHIGLHWNWIVNVFKKIFGILEKNNSIGVIAKVVVMLLFIYGAYNIYSVNYMSKVSLITTSFSGGQTERGHQLEGKPRNGSIEGTNTERRLQGDNQRVGEPLKGGRNNVSPNVIGLIARYISIISVFSIITFYFEKLVVKKKNYNNKLFSITKGEN
ncbi:MAG: DUF4405 domain-containing protein [Clostridium sp.]